MPSVLQPKNVNQAQPAGAKGTSAQAPRVQASTLAQPQPSAGRSTSPDPRDPSALAAAAALPGTPPRTRSATRVSFNDAARPNASVGRVKTLGGRQPLRAPPAAEFKVVLVGSSNAGKTSLAYRYVCGGFREATCPTVGAAFNCVYEEVAPPPAPTTHAAQRRRFGSGSRSTTPSAAPAPTHRDTVKVGLWDTAGQEQYAELVSLYFRDAHAVIFVIDSSRRDALEDLERWVKRVAAAAPPHVLRYLAVSKSDLPEEERWIERQDAVEYVSTIGMGGPASARCHSPGRCSVATTAVDDGFALNNSMAGGRAVSVAASTATGVSASRRAMAMATPFKVFEVSSVTGDGVAEMFATIASDAYTRHKAEAAARNPDGARHETSRVKPGGRGKSTKTDRRCC